MKGLLYCALLTVLLSSCFKKEIDDTEPPVTERNVWEWMDRTLLNSPSSYGRVLNAWEAQGSLYCYWSEETNGLTEEKVSVYNGEEWTLLYSDHGSGSKKTFTLANSYIHFCNYETNGVLTTMLIGNNTLTHRDTTYLNGQEYTCLLTGHSEPYRVLFKEDGVNSKVYLEKWLGTQVHWGVVDSIVGDGTVSIGTNIQVGTNPSNNVIVALQQGAFQNTYHLHLFRSSVDSFDRMYAYTAQNGNPFFFSHHGLLHVAEGTADDWDHYYLVKSFSEYLTQQTTIIDQSGGRPIFEVLSTQSGLLYTQGNVMGPPGTNAARQLTDISIYMNGQTTSYPVQLDSMSYKATQIEGMDFLGEGAHYQGGWYGFFNGQLYTLGNAYLQDAPSGKSKLFMARYLD